MLHNNSTETKKCTRFYLDFDGTLTRIAGEYLAKNADYCFLEQLSLHCNHSSPEELVSVFRAKPALGLTQESIAFLKKNIENHNEIVIISRNYRQYIVVMLLAAGLDSALISNIVIYDRINLQSANGDKGKIVEKHEKSRPTADEIMVADDNAVDACSMFNAIDKAKNPHATCISCSSGQFQWELICSSRRDDIVSSDSNAWLVREGSSHAMFTFVFKLGIKILKKRLNLTELNEMLVNQAIQVPYEGVEYVIEFVNEIQLTNNALSTNLNSSMHFANAFSSSTASSSSSSAFLSGASCSSTVTATRFVSSESIFIPPMGSPLSVSTSVITASSVMQGYLDPKIDSKEMIDYMKNKQTPSVIIYPTGTTGQFLSTIESQESKHNTAACYAISFLTLDDQVKTLKFKTKERDPQKINEELCKKLKMSIVTSMAGGHPKNTVFTELSSKSEPQSKVCSLVHIHRDKTVRPEERLFAVNHSVGTLIISTQTPSEEAKEGLCQFATRGNTGCEIERLLSTASKPLQDKWIIITGHGAAGENTIAGGYVSLFSRKAEKEEVLCDEKEYTNIFKQTGIKAGDTINILLYVCYSACSTGSEKSLAEKLALHLATEGIASSIIASKSAVKRFAGYDPNEGEIVGACMAYNVVDGPSDIVVVRGSPGNPPTIALSEGLYPDGFFITPIGLGGLEVKKALANFYANEKTVRPSLNS